MDCFDQRLNFLAARGIDLDAIHFSAGFARNLDYYTGFVFEAVEAGALDAAPVVAGGRYDRLLSTLGAKSAIPAVGAAIWIERLKPALGAPQRERK
jgi:ATP phosphoribosyltransferase regulatory subunit